MRIFGHKIIAENIYIPSVVLAFGLLLFANSDSLINTPDEAIQKLGIGKMFYIPCGIALLTSFYMPLRKDVFSTLLQGMLILTFVSSMIHPPVGDSIMSWTLTRFLFAILCFRSVANVNPYLFARCIAIVSPIIVFAHYIFSKPFEYGLYRYGGFYGDANFLSFSLLFIMVMCALTYEQEQKMYLRCVYIVTSISAVPLIFLGRSRSGMISLVVFAVVILLKIGKRNKWFMLLIALLSCYVVYKLFNAFSDSFLYALERFDSVSSNDTASSEHRLEQIESAFNVLINRPELIPFGIGLGNTLPMLNEYSNFGYYSTYVVHNTFVFFLYEAGLFVCVLYVLIYYQIIRRLIDTKNYFLFVLFFSLLIAIFTLPGVAFMPGWIALFFLCNEQLYPQQKESKN